MLNTVAVATRWKHRSPTASQKSWASTLSGTAREIANIILYADRRSVYMPTGSVRVTCQNSLASASKRQVQCKASYECWQLSLAINAHAILCATGDARRTNSISHRSMRETQRPIMILYLRVVCHSAPWTMIYFYLYAYSYHTVHKSNILRLLAVIDVMIEWLTSCTMIAPSARTVINKISRYFFFIWSYAFETNICLQKLGMTRQS